MKRAKPQPDAEGDSREQAFLELVSAVAAGDRPDVRRRIAALPGLVHEQARVGATRSEAARYFFEPIKHYLYLGDTALHMAAAGHEPRIVDDLIRAGANPSIKNHRGAEPLHYAADANTERPAAQAAIIDALVAAGADPNALDKSGVAPLHRAVRTRGVTAVEALLRLGAQARLKNASGSAPLHLAVQATGRGGSGTAQARARQKQIIDVLLASGASGADRDARGRTAHEAASGAAVEWLGSARPKLR